MSSVILASANLRDLGGIETTDGGSVRLGHLFRSGHMADLDDDELERLGSLGLRTIVDLRRDTEIEKQPTPALAGVDNLHLSTSVADNEFAVIANSLHEAELVGQADDMVAGYYAAMAVERAPFYRLVVAEAMDPDRRPLLFHCTAGKDRTGWTAAILLRLLGVSDERIIEDYVRSNEIRAPWIAQRAAQLRDRIAAAIGTDPDEIGEEQLRGARALLTVQPSYLQAAFDAVDAVFGSWDDYRALQLGVSDDALERFRTDLLE